jgi:hypothetical protein
MDISEELGGPSSPSHSPHAPQTEEIPPVTITPFSSPPVPLQLGTGTEDLHPVIKEDFEYAIGIINKKLDSMYQFCNYFDNRNKEILSHLKKLVALDELSQRFWKVINFEILRFPFQRILKFIEAL